MMMPFRLTSKIESTSLFDPKDRANESKRIDQVCTIQMKDLLNIRSAAESGLDPDLQILYTSDLLVRNLNKLFFKCRACVFSSISPRGVSPQLLSHSFLNE